MFSHCSAKTGIVPFMTLVAQVMAQDPTPPRKECSGSSTVEDRLTAFEQRYNATAQPFRWKFTPTDLEDLLARIERHEQKEPNLQQHDDGDPQPPALTAAA